MYKWIRSFLFLFPPEAVHHFSMFLLSLFSRLSFGRVILRKCFSKTDPGFAKSLFGLRFRNGVGLAAGFDKNALYLQSLETLGFGFVEIGTVTPVAQAGNDRPRLFRLKKDQALINRMGFNNDGVEKVAARLKKWREKKNPDQNQELIIGGNIGKNKATPNESAWQDYAICFDRLFPYVDYFVVNVSSPNTPGLRELQEKESLRKILTNLQDLNNKRDLQRPILLKIAPDLTPTQLDDVIDLAIEIHLSGLVVCNTSIFREHLKTSKTALDKIGAGGLSGKPIQERSTEIIRYIAEKTNNQIPIIGSGGIDDAVSAKEKINAGADLIQVWTGFIYRGPGIVSQILKKPL
jgi:dihydroorotate dehydrogenase